MTSEAESLARNRDRALRSAALGGVFSRIAVLVINLVSFAICARSLESASFGALAALSALAVILTLGDLGTGLGLVSRLARLSGTDDFDAMRRLVVAALFVMIALGLVTSVVLAVLTSTLPLQKLFGAQEVRNPELIAAAQAFAVLVGLSIPASIGQQVQIGLQRGTQVVAWASAEAVATLCFVAATAYLDWPLWTFVVALLGSPTLVRVVQSLYVLVGPRSVIGQAWDVPSLATVAQLFRVSILFFVMGSASVVFLQSGLLIVGHVRGAAAAAVLAVTLKLFASVSSTISLAGRQYWPAAAEAIVRGDGAWVVSRFRRMLFFTLASSSAGSLALVLFGRPIVRLWVGEDLVPSTLLLGLGALWTVYLTGMNQIAYLLNAAHVIREQVITAIALTVGNLVLCWYLTGSIGIYGAFVGGLVAHFVCTGIPASYLSRRELRKLEPQQAWRNEGGDG